MAFRRWRFLLGIAIVSNLTSFGLRGGTVTGTFNPVPQGSNVDLTQTGTIDWVHWGLYTETSVNRKIGVPMLISNYQLVEPLPTSYTVAYQYSDNYNGYTWYDGWRVLTQTNTHTGIWAYLAWPPLSLNPFLTGYGFRFSVPADTTTRTLKVYVGTFNSRGQLRATMSDGGVAYTDTSLSNNGNGPGGEYELSFKANSPNQTLTVQWTLYQQNGTNGDGNVTLQAAALTDANANNPPVVFLNGPIDGANYPAPGAVSLSASAYDLDGTVSGVSFYENGTSIGWDASAPYEWNWSSVPPGKYILRATATDNAGATRSSPEATVYVSSSTGSLTASVANSPAWVDLTAEGTSDWIHLGSITNTTVERKAGVSPLINVSAIGTNTLLRFNDSPTTYAWSDGTPTPANSGTTSGVYIYGYTNGFRVTAPADLIPRKLRVYVGCYGVEGRLEAYLSDFSAAAYVDRSVQSDYGSDYAVYEITYAAGSANQVLIVNFQTTSMFDALWGNVNFQAATLQGGPVELRIRTYWVDGNGFHVSFPTESGRNYTVEYSGSPSGGWQLLTQIAGTGSIETVLDPSPAPDRRFYRIVAE